MFRYYAPDYAPDLKFSVDVQNFHFTNTLKYKNIKNIGLKPNLAFRPFFAAINLAPP